MLCVVVVGYVSPVGVVWCGVCVVMRCVVLALVIRVLVYVVFVVVVVMRCCFRVQLLVCYNGAQNNTSQHDIQHRAFTTTTTRREISQ